MENNIIPTIEWLNNLGIFVFRAETTFPHLPFYSKAYF